MFQKSNLPCLNRRPHRVAPAHQISIGRPTKAIDGSLFEWWQKIRHVVRGLALPFWRALFDKGFRTFRNVR